MVSLFCSYVSQNRERVRYLEVRRWLQGIHGESSDVEYCQRNDNREGMGYGMNAIIKETSICRIHEGRPVQFPFFGLFGGATLTNNRLILIPVIRTPKYYLIRILGLMGLLGMFSALSILTSVTTSKLILLPFAIVLLIGMSDRLLLSNIRKRMGNEEDCLMIPVRSIKKVDMRRAASWNYIHVSYGVENGICDDVSFAVLSRGGFAFKKTQMVWACAIKEAMISVGDGN